MGRYVGQEPESRTRVGRISRCCVGCRAGERRLDKVRIQIDKLPWENWHDIYNEVVQPLANEGAELYCQVVIIAKGDAAIRENTVELGIKESLSQRGIEAIIQTG